MNYFYMARGIAYYLTAKHKKGYGIHSPFFYEIISSVLQNKTSIEIVRKIKDARNVCLKDKRTIDVTDLGAGSLKQQTDKRRISSIARIAAIPEKYGPILTSFASRVKGRPIIELGTSLGISSIYLGLGSPESEIITIEGSAALCEIAGETLMVAGVSNVNIVNSDFRSALLDLAGESKMAGLLYIDGDHRSDSLLEYLSIADKILDEESVVILDDIHLTRDMESGWNKAKKLPRVTASIDLLRLGILFFRKGIMRQHLTVRY